MSRRRKTAGEQLNAPLDVDPEEASALEVTVSEGPSPDETHTEDTGHDKDLDLSVEEAAPEGADDQDVPAGAPSPYEVLKKQFEEREAELKQARESREEAERRAREMSVTATKHAKDYHEAATAALDNAIELSRTNIAQSEAAMRAAAAAQDWDTFAKAQTAISENTIRRTQLEQARQQLEAGPPQVEEYKPQDPVEAQIAQFTPRSQEWLRRHKADIFGDEERRLDAQAAHRLAVRRGLTPDSDEYFDALDEQMGYTMKTFPAKAQGATAPRGAGAVAAAPPARTSFGQPQGRNPNKVNLTAEQRQTALALYPDKEEAEAIAMYSRGVIEVNKRKSNLMWSSDKYKGGNGV